MLAFTLCLLMNNAFTQNESPKEIKAIKVPDFTDAGVKNLLPILC